MPNVLEELAKVSANGTKSLGKVISERLESLSSGATVIYISPDSGSDILFSVARDLEVRGIRICGFGLVAATYRRPPSKATRNGRTSTVVSDDLEQQVFAGPGAVQPIRRGENLASEIERFVSVRK